MQSSQDHRAPTIAGADEQTLNAELRKLEVIFDQLAFLADELGDSIEQARADGLEPDQPTLNLLARLRDLIRIYRERTNP